MYLCAASTPNTEDIHIYMQKCDAFLHTYMYLCAASTPQTEKKQTFNDFFLMHRNRSIVPPNRGCKV